MLVSGATLLAVAEYTQGHPEGVSLAIIDRREAILDTAMAGLPSRRRAAAAAEYEVMDAGDDEIPAAVVYAATGSTGAGWADDLLGRGQADLL